MPEPPSDFPDMESFAEPDMPEPEPDFGEAPDIEPDFGSVEQTEPDNTSNTENLQAVSITEDIAATPAAMFEKGTDKKESDNNDNAISQQSDFIPEDVPTISAVASGEVVVSKKTDINESEVENVTVADSEAQEVPETTDTSEFLENVEDISNAKPTESTESSTEAESTDDTTTTKTSDTATEIENIEAAKDTEMPEISEPADSLSSNESKPDVSGISDSVIPPRPKAGVGTRLKMNLRSPSPSPQGLTNDDEVGVQSVDRVSDNSPLPARYQTTGERSPYDDSPYASSKLQTDGQPLKSGNDSGKAGELSEAGRSLPSNDEPETELPEICSDIDFGDIDEPDNIVFPEFDYVVEPEIPDPSELPPIESNVISIFDEDWDDDWDEDDEEGVEFIYKR